MDDDVTIKVEHVSKKFCKSLVRSMWYGLKDITRNTLGLSSHSYKLRKGEFWAVDDVSFEIRRGELLGLIGPNGSGKTTLLKMLNGIFWPDKGKITIKGRVGALIEVGAGFHPNLTGKENIYVNGAILGMTKEEIDEKYDDIVKFADIGDFINTPVKYYSSGMYVRLGFAVAIHCDTDILLIDEVLAVGDSAFRTKCLRKMHELKNKEDLTIIMVSHHLFSIEKFCETGIFLNKGKIQSHGEVHKALGAYQTFVIEAIKNQVDYSELIRGMSHYTKDIEITNVKCLNQDGREQLEFSHGDTVGIRVEYKVNTTVNNPIFLIIIYNNDGLRICDFGTIIDDIQLQSIQDDGAIEVWIDSIPLLLSKYYVYVSVQDSTMTSGLDFWHGSVYNQYFRILPERNAEVVPQTIPICKFPHKWKLNGKEIKPGA